MGTDSVPHPHQAVWDSLPFIGFDPMVLLKRKGHWISTAEEILALLPNGNVGLIADTSAGKTVITLMVALAKDYRVLFLTPQKLLTQQHTELFGKICGSTDRAIAITGDISAKKRAWDNRNHRVVFATPQCAWNDYQHRHLEPNYFDLIVFDEFHRSVGEYAYTKIARVAQEQHVSILGLSASPGATTEKVELVRRNCGIVSFVEPKIETAKKIHNIVWANPTPDLLQIDRAFDALLGSIASELQSYGLPVDPTQLLGIGDLDRLHRQIRATPRNTFYNHALSAHARYYKLLHAYRLALTEGYEPFLEYVGKLQTVDRSLARKWILESEQFSEICTVVRRVRGEHPKALQAMEIIGSLYRAGVNALVFVSLKSTARMLHAMCSAAGIPAETLFGGKDKNVAKQKEVLSALSAKKVRVVIATSVIEEGINVPEVGAVIQYSMPLTRISRLQRGGRTARINPGNVIFICLNHFLDKTFYFATLPKPNSQTPHIQEDILNTKVAHPGAFSKRKRKQSLPPGSSYELFS